MPLQKQHNYIKKLGFVLIFMGIRTNIALANELETQYARTKTLVLELDTLNNTDSPIRLEKAIETIQTTLSKPIAAFTPTESTPKVSQSTGTPPPPAPPLQTQGTPPPAPPLPGQGNPPPPLILNQITPTKTKVNFRKTTQPTPILPHKELLTETSYPNLIEFYYQNTFLGAKDYDFTLLNATQNGNHIKKIKLYTEKQRNAFLNAYKNRTKAFAVESQKLKNIITFIRDIFFNFTKTYLNNPSSIAENTKAPFNYIDKHLHNLNKKARNKLQIILNSMNLPDGTHTLDNVIEEAIKNKIAFLETLHMNPNKSLAHTEHGPLLDILYHFFQQNQDDAKQQALDYIATLIFNKKQAEEDAIEAKNRRINNLISTINSLTEQIGLNLIIEQEITFATDGGERLNEIIQQIKQKELIFAKSLKAAVNEAFPVSNDFLQKMENGDPEGYTSYSVNIRHLTQFPKIQAYRELVTSLENLKKYTQEPTEGSIAPTLAKSLKTPLITVVAKTDDIPQINNYYKEIDLDLFEDKLSDEALHQIEEMLAEQVQGSSSTEGIVKIDPTVLEEIKDNDAAIPAFNTQKPEESSHLNNTFDHEEEQSRTTTNKQTETPTTSNNISAPKNNLNKTPTTPSNQGKPGTEKRPSFPQNNLKPPAPNGDNSMLLEMLKKTISRQENEKIILNQEKQQLEIQLEVKDKTLQIQNNTINTLEKQIKQLQQQNTLLANNSKQRQLAQSTQNDSEAIIADLRKQLQEALNRPKGSRSSGFSFGPIPETKLVTTSPNNDRTSEELKTKDAQIKNLENHIQLLTAELNKARTQQERVHVNNTPTPKEQTNDFFEEMQEDRIVLPNSQTDLEEQHNQLLELKKQLELRAKELDKREKSLKLKEKSKDTTSIEKTQKENIKKKNTKKIVKKSAMKDKSSQQKIEEKNKLFE